MNDELPDSYNEIIKSVGEVCYWWSHIEFLVHDITIHFAMAVNKAFERRGPRNVLNLAITGSDFRHKIATCKAFAHLVIDDGSPSLYDPTERLLSYIDNEARTERNRYVHDLWAFDETTASRIKFGPRVTRPQARKRELLTKTVRDYESAHSIRNFALNLQHIYDDLRALDDHLAGLMLYREQRTEPPSPLPQEWRSLTHRDWREPNKR
jgi:hypothetical protein